MATKTAPVEVLTPSSEKISHDGNWALVDADDLARFKNAFQTVVYRAELAASVLRLVDHGVHRGLSEQLRQALLTLFQPPADPPASTL